MTDTLAQEAMDIEAAFEAEGFDTVTGAALAPVLRKMLIEVYTKGYRAGMRGRTVGSTAETAQAAPPDSGSTPDASTTSKCIEHCVDFLYYECCYCGAGAE